MATLKSRSGNAAERAAMAQKSSFDTEAYVNGDILGNLLKKFYALEAYTQELKNKLIGHIAGFAAIRQGLPWNIAPKSDDVAARQQNRESLSKLREDQLLMALVDGSATVNGRKIYTKTEAKLLSYASYANGFITKLNGNPAHDGSVVKCFIPAKSVPLNSPEMNGLRFHTKIVGSFITGAKDTDSHLNLVCAIVLCNPSAPREHEYENGATLTLRFGYSEVKKLDTSKVDRIYTKDLNHVKVVSLTTAIDLSASLDNKATQEEINKQVVLDTYTMDNGVDVPMEDIVREIFQNVDQIRVSLLPIQRGSHSTVNIAIKDEDVPF